MNIGDIKQFFILTSLCFASLSYAADHKCPDSPIRFATMNWETSNITTEIQRFGLENAFECDSIRIEGSTRPMLQALIAGYIDIIPELWVASVEDQYQSAKDAGVIIDEGFTSPGSIEGWWIPDYMVEKYPGLTHLSDLKEYTVKLLNQSPEQEKILFLSCPIGWLCENINQNLLKALEIEAYYDIYSPSVDQILLEKIQENYAQKVPFITYMWSPHPLLANIPLKRLKTPLYSEKSYRCNIQSTCKEPELSGFPVHDIRKIISPSLGIDHPHIASFIHSVFIPNNVMNELLSWLEKPENNISDAALHFYTDYPDIWNSWFDTKEKQKVNNILLNAP